MRIFTSGFELKSAPRIAIVDVRFRAARSDHHIGSSRSVLHKPQQKLREATISLTKQLEHIRQQQDMACIIIIDSEGRLISQVGETPEGEEFALYSPMVMETTRRMAICGGFGDPICNGVILKHGRILITHETNIDDVVIYTALLCRNKVPSGLLSILTTISNLVKKEF